LEDFSKLLRQSHLTVDHFIFDHADNQIHAQAQAEGRSAQENEALTF